jgi:hypothetical protein
VLSLSLSLYIYIYIYIYTHLRGCVCRTYTIGLLEEKNNAHRILFGIHKQKRPPGREFPSLSLSIKNSNLVYTI